MESVIPKGALMCRNWPMMAQWTIGWAGGAWGQWGLRNRHSLAWTLHLAIWGAHAIWQIAITVSQITGSKDLGYDTDCTRVDFFNEFKHHHFWSHHFLLIYFAANLGGHWICEVLQKKPSIFAIGMHLNKYWIAHFLIDQQSNDDDGDYVCGGGDNIRHAWNGFGGDGIAEACKLRNNKSPCVTLIFAQYPTHCNCLYHPYHIVSSLSSSGKWKEGDWRQGNIFT